MKFSSKTFVLLICVASIIGAVVAFYALLAHYDAASSDFCSISEKFDCSIVNKSKYSKFLNIPVSLLGLFAYVFFFFSSLYYLKSKSLLVLQAMIFAAAFGLVFSLYLTYIEAFVLYTWCLLCVTSLVSMFLVAAGVAGLHLSNVQFTKDSPNLTE